MLFSTFDYFVFLPLVAAAHWALGPNSAKTWLLLLASAAFYLAWNPVDAVVLVFVALASYLAAVAVESVAESKRPAVLAGSALVILGPLLFYKYVHFAAENLALLVPALPVPPKQHLPIGVSFYSFQALAYVIDVRRGEPRERNLVRYATFLCFFPHLVAGPILRAKNLLAQLAAERSLSREDVGYGIFRLCVGLAKKLLVADVLRLGMVDSVFTDPTAFTGPEVLVSLYAYTLQIYADFSGYTDFAIGSARLLGFRIPENFDRPYQALSVASYWTRWHMTLSAWVKDYVYFPLGGSRGTMNATFRNTMITLLILGAWHGANWTFIVYGLLHGTAVCLNRWWRTRPGWTDTPGVFGSSWRWLLTFQFVVLARILFRSDDLAHAGVVVSALLDRWDLAMPRYSLHAWTVLLAGYAVHFTPKAWAVGLRGHFGTLPAPIWGAALVAAGWACARFGAGDSLAFIYYSF